MTAGRAFLLVGLWPSSPGRIATSSAYACQLCADRASATCPFAMEFISAVAVGLTWLQLPLREALGSRRCGCGLDVVLCPLVSILGRVVFVIFS